MELDHLHWWIPVHIVLMPDAPEFVIEQIHVLTEATLPCKAALSEC